MQDIENTPNKDPGPTRISDWLLDQLKDEQRIQEKKGNKKPTYKELLDWAWKTARAAGSRHEPESSQKGAVKPPIEFPVPETAEWKAYREAFSPPENRRLLKILVDCIRSGNALAIHAVKAGLELGTAIIEGQGPGSGAASHRRGKR